MVRWNHQVGPVIVSTCRDGTTGNHFNKCFFFCLIIITYFFETIISNSQVQFAEKVKSRQHFISIWSNIVFFILIWVWGIQKNMLAIRKRSFRGRKLQIKMALLKSRIFSIDNNSECLKFSFIHWNRYKFYWYSMNRLKYNRIVTLIYINLVFGCN